MPQTAHHREEDHQAAYQPAIEADHRDLIRSRRQRRRFVVEMRRISRKGSGVHHARIWHESDGSCCRAEPWSITALKLQRQLALDGDRALWAFTGESAAQVAPPVEVGR